jgi:hypothetical protein
MGRSVSKPHHLTPAQKLNVRTHALVAFATSVQSSMIDEFSAERKEGNVTAPIKRTARRA